MTAPTQARALWITPSPLSGPQRSYDRVAAALGDSADIALIGLQVWDRSTAAPYDIAAEVDAVARTAAELGLSRFHLFGFSAGATVALAAALRLGESIRSVTVFEPATIGDDDWDPLEARWRRDIETIGRLPVESRDAAFAALMMAPVDVPTSSRSAPTSSWDARRDLLETMLANVGFVSGDLQAITQPCLVVTGGRSHPRFEAVADRLLDVLPNAQRAHFADRSHLSPPMRDEPDAFADLLRRFWDPLARLV